MGQPKNREINPRDKLEMFGFRFPLFDEENDQGGGEEGHAKDNVDPHLESHPSNGARIINLIRKRHREWVVA